MSFQQEPTMECPHCKELEFEHIDTLRGQGRITLEYECGRCKEIAYFDAPLPKTKTMAIAWTVPKPEQLEKEREAFKRNPLMEFARGYGS